LQSLEQQKKSILSERPFFENLNGLRFSGALMVFIFHCFTLNREIWGDFTDIATFKFIYKLASKGHHGVGFFFVLSGFLITFLLLNEISKNGSINVKHFFMRRILRIWPLYFLLILFGFYIFPYLPFGQSTHHSILLYGSFLSNIDEIAVGLIDNLNFLTVTWSVSIEEQFYLSWMLLMSILPFFRKGKYFHIYFIFLIAFSIGFRAFNYADERTIYFHTFSVISDLAIGGLLAYLVQKYSIQRILKPIKKLHILSIYAAGISMIIASNVIFKGVLVSMEKVVIGLFFAFVILEQVYSENSFYKIDKFPYFFQSGKLTYGFYMFHCVFIYYWSIFFANHGFTDSVWQFTLYILVVFISTYATAYLSMKYFEKPLLGLKRHFR
jgi:peptidoglycan/LPS O-acetylase OafA/YrhL